MYNNLQGAFRLAHDDSQRPLLPRYVRSLLPPIEAIPLVRQTQVERMDYPRNHDSHLRQRQLQANALVPAHVEGLETSHVVLLGPVGGQEALR